MGGPVCSAEEEVGGRAYQEPEWVSRRAWILLLPPQTQIPGTEWKSVPRRAATDATDLGMGWRWQRGEGGLINLERVAKRL